MYLNKTLLVLALTFLFISCNLEALGPALNVEGQNGFTYPESRALWIEMKKENGNSYEYTVGVMSWTGDGSNTTMTIEEGKVVAREYQEYFMDPDTGVITEGVTYTETGAEVGNNTAGAQPLTIDELYVDCLSDYLMVDTGTNTVSFETDEVGILTLCGYVPDGCADDCFEGFSLSGFKWL